MSDCGQENQCWRVRGWRIRELRLRWSWRQEELASQAEISVRTLSRYESELVLIYSTKSRSADRFETLRSISSALEVDMAELIEPHESGVNQAGSNVELATAQLSSSSQVGSGFRDYVNRPEEDHALHALGNEPGPLVIYSPDDFGKTTLLSYLLAGPVRSLSETPPRIIRNNVERLSSRLGRAADPLLCAILLEVLQPSADDAMPLAVPEPESVSKTLLLRRFADYLAGLAQPLFLTIEKLDAVEDLSVVRELLRISRSWIERHHERGWANLQLIITVGTYPLLLEDPHLSSSFFDLCSYIRLQALSEEKGLVSRIYG